MLFYNWLQSYYPHLQQSGNLCLLVLKNNFTSSKKEKSKYKQNNLAMALFCFALIKR